MEQTLLDVAAKNGIFALLTVIIGYILWREMRRMQDEARAREERLSAEAKAERDRMHSEAIAREERMNTEAREREDRLMKLAEGLTDRFETLASQYETLALDVRDIKAVVHGKDGA